MIPTKSTKHGATSEGSEKASKSDTSMSKLTSSLTLIRAMVRTMVMVHIATYLHCELYLDGIWHIRSEGLT